MKIALNLALITKLRPFTGSVIPFAWQMQKKKLIKKPFLLSWRWHSGFIIGVEILACSLPLALHLADCQDNRLKCLVRRVFKNSLIKYISYLGLLFPSHLKILHTRLRFWKLNLCFLFFHLFYYGKDFTKNFLYLLFKNAD